MSEPSCPTPAPRPAALPFEAAALEQWLSAHLEGFQGPLQIEKFPGGQSNPSYRQIGRAHV